MPYSRSRYRRYRRYVRRYRPRYRRYKARSSIVNSRSRLRVRIPVNQICGVTIPANSGTSTILRVMPWCSTTQTVGNLNTLDSNTGQCLGATRSSIFQAYRQLFDEVKCDGLKVRFTIVDTIGIGGTWTGMNLVSAIDRMYHKGDPAPTVDTLQSYSSVSNTMVVTNGYARQARSCWASDLQEKTLFADSDTNTTTIANSNVLGQWASGYQSTLFSPCVMFGINSNPSAGTAGATVNVKVDVEFYFTFRNPKASGSSSSKDAAIDALIAANPDAATTVVRAAAELSDDQPSAKRTRTFEIDPIADTIDDLYEEASRSSEKN